MEEQFKECSKCHQILPLDCFRWKNKALNKKHSQCKECEKIADKKHYQESLERQTAVKTATLLRQENNINLVEEKKKSGCIKCGEKRPYLLDFHHLNPEEKINTIAHMIKSSSYDSLKNEIDKCVILCANCHREWHYFKQIKPELTFKEYLKS